MTGSRKSPTTRRRLRELIEDATVDCYTDDEKHWAFLSVLQHRITCPFTASVVGEEVEVRGFDWDGTPQGIMAEGADVPGQRNRPGVGRPASCRRGMFDAYRSWLEGKW